MIPGECVCGHPLAKHWRGVTGALVCDHCPCITGEPAMPPPLEALRPPSSPPAAVPPPSPDVAAARQERRTRAIVRAADALERIADVLEALAEQGRRL